MLQDVEPGGRVGRIVLGRKGEGGGEERLVRGRMYR